jgi:nicotinamide riboside kinase
MTAAASARRRHRARGARVSYIWFEPAWNDYLYWQSTDRKIVKRIDDLLRDIDRNGGEDYANELAAKTGTGMDDLVWTTEHFANIAHQQTRLENAAALACPLVIADTDAFATSIWERRYVGEHSHGTAEAAGPLLPRHDLYLVTDHLGVPFEQDGWRDGEGIRTEMTEWFVDGLTERRLPWVLLRGAPDERLSYAIEAVEPLLERRLNFS